jgi:hypothetical protein
MDIICQRFSITEFCKPGPYCFSLHMYHDVVHYVKEKVFVKFPLCFQGHFEFCLSPVQIPA